MKDKIMVGIFLLFLLVSFNPVQAYSISGQVWNISNASESLNASIACVNSSFGSCGSTQANNTGHWNISALSNDNYTITASMSRYGNNFSTYQILNANITTANLSLRKLDPVGQHPFVSIGAAAGTAILIAIYTWYRRRLKT